MIKTTSTALDEIEAALGKVKLASRLGCTAAELKKIVIDINPDKIGRVIGKNGSTINQLETNQRVVMDVDSVKGKIHLTGAEASLQNAIFEINKICTAVDVDVQVPMDLLFYFTTKVCICVIVIAIVLVCCCFVEDAVLLQVEEENTDWHL